MATITNVYHFFRIQFTNLGRKKEKKGKKKKNCGNILTASEFGIPGPKKICSEELKKLS